MKKRGSSELIAEILLIIIVIIVLAFVVYFFIGYLKEREERAVIQRGVDYENNRLNINDVDFDPADNQNLTLELEKGPGGQYKLSETTRNVSRINVTIVRIINQTNVTHTDITYVLHNATLNGSDADIAIVNDMSGSMSFDNKMSGLKVASKEFIERILNGTTNNVSLVSYESYVVDEWSVPLTNNLAELFSIIDLYSPLRSTCICCGIERGMLYLNASNRTKIMIVLSDGGANWDCDYYSPELSGNPPTGAGTGCGLEEDDPCDDAINITKSGFIDRQVITHSIGFGNESSVDEMTLRNISIVGNGSYYFSNISELSSIFEKIYQNISWLEEVVITWNETVTTTWIEQINETINETVEIEVYAPETYYDYLKIVFHAGGRSCSQKQNVSSVPAPLETKKVDLTISPSCGMTADQLTKIEIYAVALTEGGQEVVSSAPIATWEKESMYTRK